MAEHRDFLLSSALFENPKFLALQGTCGAEGAIALLRLWAHVASTGNLRATGHLGLLAKPRAIEMAAGWTGEPGEWFEAVMALGLLEYDEDYLQYRVHDWVSHQPKLTTEQQRKEIARKGAAARWSKRKKPTKKKQAKRESDVPPKDSRPAFREKVLALWNEVASPVGFAQVRSMSDQRARSINATIDWLNRQEKGRGLDLEVWRMAFARYADDVRRWPDRINFGFDTFIRPLHRAKWFEGHGNAAKSDFDGWDFS